MEYLGAQGALVWVEAEHMCMNMRGVRKPGTATVTTAARGLLAIYKFFIFVFFFFMCH